MHGRKSNNKEHTADGNETEKSQDLKIEFNSKEVTTKKMKTEHLRSLQDVLVEFEGTNVHPQKNDNPAFSTPIVRPQEKKGRFLRKREEQLGMLFGIGDVATRDKTSQSLRIQALQIEVPANLETLPKTLRLNDASFVTQAEYSKLLQEIRQLRQETCHDVSSVTQAEKLLQEYCQLRQYKENLSTRTLDALINKPFPVLKFQARGSGKSNLTNRNHKKADINRVGKFKLNLRDTSIPNPIHQFWEYETSCLLSKLAKLSDLGKKEHCCQYFTESDISAFVSPAIDDAACLAGVALGMSFGVRHEYSLFSQRPDHLVVFHSSTGCPLVAVEDKKPWNNDDDLESVYGQVFDYASVLLAFGNVVPFVVLSSFKDSLLFWLDEEETNTTVAEMDFEGTESLRACCQNMNNGSKKMTPSPRELKLESPIFGVVDTKCFGTFESDSNQRKLNCANVYKYCDLVPLLYTAILCAVKMNTHTYQDWTPKNYSELPMGLKNDSGALKMTTAEYQWGRLETIVGNQIGTGCDSAYYVISIIGIGNTFKVFLALTHLGKPVVIKMYVKREKGLDEHGNNRDHALAEIATRTEVANLKELYPSLEQYVTQEKILEFYCVIMPFLRPLTKVEQETKEDQITNVLQKFWNIGRKYREEDLCWRHIGMFTHTGTRTSTSTEEIILYDLADLVDIDKKVETNFVKDSWSKLENWLQKHSSV
jgi:Family of unknown function (DUF5898)